MELQELTALSPIDGRYRKQNEALASYFSEYGLLKYRVKVEIEYFITLTKLNLPQLPPLLNVQAESVLNIATQFSLQDALQIKEIEKTTNHDIKAVEYFIKNKFTALGLTKQLEFIHFGLTSQDINNTAIPLLLKDATYFEYLPQLQNLITYLKVLAKQWQHIPMLARTHGQPASPTTVGKEIYVFVERLSTQINKLSHLNYAAKFGGATGNFNAHAIAFPNINWIQFANDFVNDTLKLKRSQFTTQIEHYDSLAEYCDTIKRINVILIDLAKDMWQYISLDYFKQKLNPNEVGSSAMPHKVNPIDFENAEGNLGVANALWIHLAEKLPISRLQRDLTDSTVLRNIGVPFAHSTIAIKSLYKGLQKLIINETAIAHDLEQNWAVVAEAIQTILRRENFPKPYEALKELTRQNATITKDAILQFISNLNVSESIKQELLKISPFNYIGKNPEF